MRDPLAKLDQLDQASQPHARLHHRKRDDGGGDIPLGVPRFNRSVGQKMLLDAPGTYDELSMRIGASRQSLLDWRKGTRVPSLSARKRMLDGLGIPIEAWATPWQPPGASTAVNTNASGGAPAPAAAPPGPNAPTAPPVDRPPDALPPPPVAVGGTTIEQCLHLIAVIRADRAAPNLLPSERVKLVDSESKLLKLLADLQARAELSEDRYVREHPAWIRVRNAIAEALKPHPAAAQAVAAALDRLGI